MNKLTRISILLLIITLGCKNTEKTNKNNDEKNTDVNELNIRIENVSDFDFDNVVLNTSTGDVPFGSIKSKETTGYKIFDKAYSYAYIKLMVDGEEYSFQPIDYVSEEAVVKGVFTYIVDFNPNNEYEKISIELD